MLYLPHWVALQLIPHTRHSVAQQLPPQVSQPRHLVALQLHPRLLVVQPQLPRPRHLAAPQPVHPHPLVVAGQPPLVGLRSHQPPPPQQARLEERRQQQAPLGDQLRAACLPRRAEPQHQQPPQQARSQTRQQQAHLAVLPSAAQLERLLAVRLAELRRPRAHLAEHRQEHQVAALPSLDQKIPSLQPLLSESPAPQRLQHQQRQLQKAFCSQEALEEVPLAEVFLVCLLQELRQVLLPAKPLVASSHLQTQELRLEALLVDCPCQVLQVEALLVVDLLQGAFLGAAVVPRPA